MHWRPTFLLGLTIGLGCSGPSEAPVTELSDATQAPPPTTLIRLPRDGGAPRLYFPGTLTEIDWKVPVGDLLPVQQTIGADLDQRLAFVLSQDSSVVGIDLASGHVRTFIEGVTYAILGPDGTLFTVDSTMKVSQLHRRTPVRFGTQLEATPRAAFGTRSGQLMVLSDSGDTALTVLSGDQPSLRVALPAGPTAATHWGDLLAVATDSGAVLYEASATEQVRFLPLDPAPRQIAFSPSGHRMYTIGAEPSLTVIDRYGEKVLGTIDLPGPARELRSDPYGGWLLIRPGITDSVWVVDVGTSEIRGQVGTAWSGAFPTIIGTMLLVRQGEDIVALDMKEDIFFERGRITNGAEDLYLTVAWTPTADDRYSEVLASRRTADPASAGATIYLQISSSRNPEWAQGLVNQMLAAGLPASRLDPAEGEEAYRVVLGPYATREEAEAVANNLGRPSFIYQPRVEQATVEVEPEP